MTSYEPRRPLLAATGLCVLWVAILCIPMMKGMWLVSQFGDQFATGYAFRHWGAEQWRALGHVPLWNPMIFGGLPFVGAMHGDIFYPTSFLRLVLPTATVMNLGFAVHYVLAGLFVYALLRRLRIGWSGAVTGAMAYQLSGVIVSYVAPGHDGKLFVTAMLPLALLGLVIAMRERRFWGYGVVAFAVGGALLSPHAQATYYMLVACGIFALYLAFGEPDGRTPAARVTSLALALAAVLVGFLIGAIQIVPFLHYLPYSPRASGTVHGYEWATSYAIPWQHFPEFFLSGFTGRTEAGTYWGPNFLKLHSEYLGLPVLALMLIGLGDRERRRFISWVAGIGALFLLVGMGADTPFYRVWWAVMPFMNKVRAAGMALYVVALMIAMLAALGVNRLERGEARTWWTTWLAGGIVVALLAVVGVFGSVALALSRGVPWQQAPSHAAAAQDAIRWGAFGSGVALAVLGLLTWSLVRSRISIKIFAIAVPLLVGADMWRAGRDFWYYQPAPTQSAYALDAVTSLLTAPSQTTPDDQYPGRVLDLRGDASGSSLMAFGIPQLIGYHGFELNAFDVLMDRANSFRNIGSPRLRNLFAVRYIIVPTGEGQGDSLPGYHRRLKDVQTSFGQVTLLEADTTPPYARLVPAAFKWNLPKGLDCSSPHADSAFATAMTQATMAIVNPLSKFDADRLVLLDPCPTPPIEPAHLDSLPPALDANVHVTKWTPEAITLQIDPAAPSDAYVLVGENYYPMWRATVDGSPASVERGDVSLIAVPVKAGAKTVELHYSRQWYRTGKEITLAGVALALLGLIVPIALRRRRA